MPQSSNEEGVGDEVNDSEGKNDVVRAHGGHHLGRLSTRKW